MPRSLRPEHYGNLILAPDRVRMMIYLMIDEPISDWPSQYENSHL